MIRRNDDISRRRAAKLCIYYIATTENIQQKQRTDFKKCTKQVIKTMWCNYKFVPYLITSELPALTTSFSLASSQRGGR